ncbi:tetratricopeptide repeat protein [Magnetospirillum sp. SS-4]|uniref:tetratricopeptide repeat protein n=1 Tax=Magnetospirillum sp. SS-4 TaxID=2681465 RepID=UPI0013824301|nr:tetratricopeptide repeat protein [Magnetospirillum sp. SS-4]CAA7618702.1 conserved hypothetical protein [Magnetospirillum sp. SS-4]
MNDDQALDVGIASPGDPSAAEIAALLDEAGLALRTGDVDAAIRAYARVIRIDPGHVEARLAMARIRLRSGELHRALESCLAILEIDPRHIGARLETAEALRRLGRSEDAHAIHDLLLNEQPESPYAWTGLAGLLADEGHAAAAEACLRRALALKPTHVAAVAALAGLRDRRRDHVAAIELWHDAIDLDPDAPGHHAGLARSLMALGRLDEAALRLDRALALDGEHMEARLARADLRLLAGREEDWREDAEWRWLRPGHQRPRLPGAAWTGQDAPGTLLLLHAEDDLSDAIRLLRHLPLLTGRGFRIALMVPPAMTSLAGDLGGVERVLRLDRPVPLDLEADFHAALADLPHLTGLPPSSLPESPWLEAAKRRRRPILAPPDAVLRVGLAWEGGIPFPLLLPLSECPGVVLFALEFGSDPSAAATLADPSLVTDLGPAIADLADLAGRVAELDLVVAADCPTAHLAAALGKPVLLLLPVDCHPRWTRNRETSAWYPGMRLFRQDTDDDWRPVIARVAAELRRRTEERRRERTELRAAHAGPEAAQRALLAAHLRPDDLLVDIESGENGGFIPERNDLRILALEPNPAAAARLRQAMAERPGVEVADAALGRNGVPVLVSRVGRCGGRRVFPLPPGIPGTTVTVTLASLLDGRPDLAGRRLVLRLGQAGWDSDILAGLDRYRPAVMTFRHVPGADAAEQLAQAGFSLWRFPTGTAFGPVVPFTGEAGIVLALRTGEVLPAAHYGPAALPPSPEDVAAAHAEAERLTGEGLAHQAARRLGETAAAYAGALMNDPFATAANANKGVLMHMAGRREAAISCYRRALVRAANPAVATNLGTALRELRRHDEADAAIAMASAALPDSPDRLYDLALLRRDQGRLADAADLLRRIGDSRPGAAWTLAQILVAAGETAEGFALFRHRPAPPPPSPDIPAWQGEDLSARSVLVHQDCDDADAILLARFIPQLAGRGGLTTLVCQPGLMPLMEDLSGVERVTGDDGPFPICDLRAGLTDLPRLLAGGGTPRLACPPYLFLPAGLRPRRPARDERLRVGLSWGGRPAGRGCFLADLLALAADPDLALVALGDEAEIRPAIRAAGARSLVERPIPAPADLAETAAVIAGLNVVVGGDTAELHLAAALGKPVRLLLPDAFTWRWPHGRDDSPWYPSARVFRQSADGSWTHAIERVRATLQVLMAKKRG